MSNNRPIVTIDCLPLDSTRQRGQLRSVATRAAVLPLL